MLTEPEALNTLILMPTGLDGHEGLEKAGCLHIIMFGVCRFIMYQIRTRQKCIP